MTSVKSLFDAQCGAEAPILLLSKNFNKTNNLLPSSSNELISTKFLSNQTDLITDEYLQNISKKTIPPNTFNMSEILQQIKPSSSLSFNTNEKLRNQHDKNLALAKNWTNDFIKTNKDIFKKADNWSNCYSNTNNSSSKYSELNEVWNEVVETKNSENNLLSKPQLWASDYLEKFDNANNLNITSTNFKDNVLSYKDDWIDEFTNKNLDKLDFLNDYKELNDDAFEIFSNYENEWQNIELGLLNKKKYEFNTENSFINDTDLINKAKNLFSQGNVADAILCYEAALQKNPQDSDTWCSLGLCHAENERDIEAIEAFKCSLELNPLNQRTILAMAASLANENMDSAALRHLDQWITIFSSTETSNINVSAAFVDDQFIVNENWIKELELKFLNAINFFANNNQLSNSETIQTSELYNALSVYYNIIGNHDKAIESIRQAISIDPKNPVLWNRLGASIANSERSAEAISAYRNALEIFPAYVRARYNLGISCMNLSAYRDAISHFLSALRLQKQKQNVQIWSKIRSCVIRLPEYVKQSSSLWTKNALDAIEARDIEALERLNSIR